jgi:prepilin-type N-terminal cleavage/methylation domain-containing protein
VARTAKAFTLIEILVVVLIIGILAAIALPQYQIAVAKAKFSQIFIFMNSLEKAEQMYYLTNGQFTADFGKLDITMPEGASISKSEDLSVITYSNGYQISLQDNLASNALLIRAYPPITYFYLRKSSGQTSRKDCRAEINDTKGNKLCKSIGAVYNHNDGKTNMYYL